MTSLQEGRTRLVQILRDGEWFGGGVTLITSLGTEHGAQLISGVFNNVIDRAGNEHREVQTGKNGIPNFLVRIGLGPDQIVCTGCPTDMYRGIAERFLATPPDQHTEPEEVMGVGQALKQDGPNFARQHLRSKLLKHVLVSALYYDIFPLAGIWGPSASVHRGRTYTRRKALNKIVDELLNCGMTMEEIQSQFIDCLKFKSQGRPIDFVLKLACAKCFPENQVHHKLSDVLHEHYFERFWRDIVWEPHKHSGELLPFGYLARQGMVGEFERVTIRALLTCRMADGKTRQAYEIVDGIGELLDLFNTRTHPGFCLTKSPMQCHRECVMQTLASFVPVAFSVAQKKADFGIAAGLLHTFGAKACAPDKEEELTRQVVRHAFEKNQPVPMELHKYYDLV